MRRRWFSRSEDPESKASSTPDPAAPSPTPPVSETSSTTPGTSAQPERRSVAFADAPSAPETSTPDNTTTTTSVRPSFASRLREWLPNRIKKTDTTSAQTQSSFAPGTGGSYDAYMPGTIPSSGSHSTWNTPHYPRDPFHPYSRGYDYHGPYSQASYGPNDQPYRPSQPDSIHTYYSEPYNPYPLYPQQSPPHNYYPPPSSTYGTGTYNTTPSSSLPGYSSAPATSGWGRTQVIEEQMPQSEAWNRRTDVLTITQETDANGTKRMISQIPNKADGLVHTYTLQDGVQITCHSRLPSKEGGMGTMNIQFAPKGYTPRFDTDTQSFQPTATSRMEQSYDSHPPYPPPGSNYRDANEYWGTNDSSIRSRDTGSYPPPSGSAYLSGASASQMPTRDTEEGDSMLDWVSRGSDLRIPENVSSSNRRLSNLVSVTDNLMRRIGDLNPETARRQARNLIDKREAIARENNDVSMKERSTYERVDDHLNNVLNYYRSQGHSIRDDINTLESLVMAPANVQSHRGTSVIEWMRDSSRSAAEENDRLNRYLESVGSELRNGTRLEDRSKYATEAIDGERSTVPGQWP